MPDEPHTPLESDLRSLRPSGLDPALLDRLESAAEGTWTDLDPLEKQLEAELRHQRPARVPEALMAALEAATDGVEFPGDRAVVPFSPAVAERESRSKGGGWKAAAAVAVLGALSALMLPPREPAATTAAKPAAPALESPAGPATSALTPAQFSRKLSETHDEGVIWPSNRQPFRVVKVVYMDQVTLTRDDGTTYQVEQPRVEYYMVPAQSH